MRRVGVIVAFATVFALGVLTGWLPAQRSLSEAHQELAGGQSDSEQRLEDALNDAAADLLNSEATREPYGDAARDFREELSPAP